MEKKLRTKDKILQASIELFNQVGERQVRGVELGVVGAITSAWQISAGAAYMDSEITRGNQSGNNLTDGGVIQWTPELTFTLWNTYELPLGLTLGGGVRYVDTVVRSSSTTLNLAKTAVVEMPDYWVVDAMASYPVTPYVDVQLNVYNLLDEEYQANISTGTNALAVALGSLSTWEDLLIERLRQRGVAIVYISHRLEELQRVAQRIVVLRDGKLVCDEPIQRYSSAELVNLMVGRELGEHIDLGRREIGAPLLQVDRLSRGDKVRDVSFQVRAGEIFGISGLIGAGRTELLRLIYGADRADSGSIALGQPPQAVTIDSPKAAVKAGIAKSKFNKYPDFGQKLRGHIMLTDHGDEAWFRAIKLRELPSP